jgi:hypothetical protein
MMGSIYRGLDKGNLNDILLGRTLYYIWANTFKLDSARFSEFEKLCKENFGIEDGLLLRTATGRLPEIVAFESNYDSRLFQIQRFYDFDMSETFLDLCKSFAMNPSSPAMDSLIDVALFVPGFGLDTFPETQGFTSVNLGFNDERNSAFIKSLLSEYQMVQKQIPSIKINNPYDQIWKEKMYCLTQMTYRDVLLLLSGEKDTITLSKNTAVGFCDPDAQVSSAFKIPLEKEIVLSFKDVFLSLDKVLSYDHFNYNSVFGDLRLDQYEPTATLSSQNALSMRFVHELER